MLTKFFLLSKHSHHPAHDGSTPQAADSCSTAGSRSTTANMEGGTRFHQTRGGLPHRPRGGRHRRRENFRSPVRNGEDQQRDKRNSTSGRASRPKLSSNNDVAPALLASAGHRSRRHVGAATPNLQATAAPLQAEAPRPTRPASSEHLAPLPAAQVTSGPPVTPLTVPDTEASNADTYAATSCSEILKNTILIGVGVTGNPTSSSSNPHHEPT